MAYQIPDPKWEMPELLTPKRKPTGNVKIDYKHPLAKGLVGCWLLREKKSAIDLTGNNQFSIADSFVGHGYGKDGSYIKATHTYSRLLIANIADENPLMPTTDALSIYTITERPDPADGLFPILIDKSTAGSGTNGWCLGFIPGSNQIVFYVDTDYNTAVESDSTIGLTHGYGISASSSAGVDFYTDGKPLSPLSVNSFTWSTNAANFSLLNYTTVDSYQWLYPVYCVYIWDRVLSDKEHKSIDSNPYQILIPE